MKNDMKNNFLALLIIVLHIGSFAFSLQSEGNEELQHSDEALFVSLGSFCEPTHMLRFCDRRKAAFPFDWIISFDGEAVIEMLQNGFDDFFNDVHFLSFGPAGALLQNRYHLEFLHDGNFNHQFAVQFEELKQKYKRRIDRFYSLRSYPGKVYFMRNANIHSTTDPHRFFRCSSNLEITDDYALRLYEVLKCVFPDLDFDLLIVNPSDGNSLVEQKVIFDHVRIFNVSPYLEQSQKIEAYRAFFDRIIKEDSVIPQFN